MYTEVFPARIQVSTAKWIPSILWFFVDLKLHLQGTDYGNFLADEAGQLTVSIIQDKLLQKFIEQFESMRSQVVEPAASFFEYMTYVCTLTLLKHYVTLLCLSE